MISMIERKRFRGTKAQSPPWRTEVKNHENQIIKEIMVQDNMLK